MGLQQPLIKLQSDVGHEVDFDGLASSKRPEEVLLEEQIFLPGNRHHLERREGLTKVRNSASHGAAATGEEQGEVTQT